MLSSPPIQVHVYVIGSNCSQVHRSLFAVHIVESEYSCPIRPSVFSFGAVFLSKDSFVLYFPPTCPVCDQWKRCEDFYLSVNPCTCMELRTHWLWPSMLLLPSEKKVTWRELDVQGKSRRFKINVLKNSLLREFLQGFSDVVHMTYMFIPCTLKNLRNPRVFNKLLNTREDQ